MHRQPVAFLLKLIGNVQSAQDRTLTAEDRQWFLANLAADPGETTNWLRKNPEAFARLRRRHAEWLAQARPTANAAGTPDAPALARPESQEGK